MLDKAGATKRTVIELDTHKDGEKIQSLLLKMTGQRTVPNIFIGGEHIGGCDDLKALDSNNLRSKVQAVTRTASNTKALTSEAGVDAFVAKHPVVIFSKTYCPYCKEAKRILDAAGAKNRQEIELDTDPNGVQIQKALYQSTAQRTVPNIFIGGRHIGGCDDLRALPNDVLNQKLQAAMKQN